MQNDGYSSVGRRAQTLSRRRRVSLACTSCRQRKSRCDGQRPSCSPCLEIETSCEYEEVSRGSDKRRQRRQSEHARLKQRVGELEARLNTVACPEAISEVTIAGADHDLSPYTSPMTSVLESVQRSSCVPVITPGAYVDHPIDDVAVDTLATAAFDKEPEDLERNIGYFGPTSNHALFRSLADVFARIVHLFPPSRHRSGVNSAHNHLASASPSPHTSVRCQSQEVPDQTPELRDLDDLSNYQDLILLINQFFSTVGMVLPYLNKSALLSECTRSREDNNRQLSRPMRALLNIICAHASSVYQSRDAEVYYRRALLSLDEHTLRGSSLELIQALLLISSFQQNSQRSVASWTQHAVAVKAAFQLGLHSPKAYKNYNLRDSELRKRLWYAVVNQDRCLSISLGRPCMIPAQHIQVERPKDPSSNIHTMSTILPDHMDSLLYFNHNILLHDIKGSTIDILYGHNVENLEPLPSQELIIRRLRLSWQLEQWRQHSPSFCEILADADLSQWNTTSYHNNRYRVLLSIQYYSTILLINFPALVSFLTEGVMGHQSARELAVQMDEMILIIKNDLMAARELSAIIYGAATRGGTFINSNAAWWMCNYIMFTANLHLFGILLICKLHYVTLSTTGIELTEVRSALDHGLVILQAVERSSLMSRKAGQCLSGFLKIFDSLLPERSTITTSSTDSQENESLTQPTPDGFPTLSEGLLPNDFISQYVAQSADDFLFMCSNNNFLDADFSLYDAFNEPYSFGDMPIR